MRRYNPPFNGKRYLLNMNTGEIQSFKLCTKWDISDIKSTVAELKRAGLGDMYYSGGFRANDQFIIYMENRFKNGFNEVTDFISKFIP